MACFYKSDVERFLRSSTEDVIAQLALGYAATGFTSQYSDQTLTWKRDIDRLREILRECASKSSSANLWGLLLEFSIPRKEQRLDAVLLAGGNVIILEAKSSLATLAAERQIEEYALQVHYFHKASAERPVFPIIVSPEERLLDLSELRSDEIMPQLPSFWVRRVVRSSWAQLSQVVTEIAKNSGQQIDLESWDSSPYFPVPTVIDAALALKSGLSIREVAHSEASELEIEHVRSTIQGFVDDARVSGKHAICFVTGVPGSGKTLVGLSIAHAKQNQGEAIHFMSGNGPLVKVLQHLFTQEGMARGIAAPQARTEARTLLENVHVFAKYYTEINQGPPSNHAIIFDEAQRAWNRAQNKKKFKRDYSEPEMLLRIMERHHNWAFVVALVGGGQEINDGEAGLEEWGRALLAAQRDWTIYASPEVLEGGPSTAGHRLFDPMADPKPIQTSSALHLRTSNRSLRAEQLTRWVNFVLNGDAAAAVDLRVPERFPIFLSRSLSQTRRKLREVSLGGTRFGLAGSSGAARLRAEGLEPSSAFHADYPWQYWYLAEDSDVRSSYQCEVFATEFEIQGLELDWTGVCWGGDFVWKDNHGWRLRAMRHGAPTKWNLIKNAEKQNFRRNAYRVLLTRARQGMIIFVPTGEPNDLTNSSEDFDSTARFLERCGVQPLQSE